MRAPYSVDLRGMCALARKEAGRDEPSDCGGAADQPVMRIQVDEAQARDGLARPRLRSAGYKTPHALGRERRLAAGAHRRRAVPIAEACRPRLGRNGGSRRIRGRCGCSFMPRA